MANQEQLEIIKQGVEVWNTWRRKSSDVKIDLSGADLSGTDLSGADLSGADLSGADLSGANLSVAILIRAILSEANLIGANLIGANLIGADLIGANLSGAHLEEADLSGAHLRRAHLRRAILQEANLWGANLSGADLSGANLSRVNLSRAKLWGVNLKEANLVGAIFRETYFYKTDLSPAQLNQIRIMEQEYMAQRKAEVEAERRAVKKSEEESKGKEEHERLDALKALAEQLAREEAARLAAQKAEEGRIMSQKLEAERERKAKAEAEYEERLAALRVEEERRIRQMEIKERERYSANRSEEERIMHQEVQDEREYRQAIELHKTNSQSEVFFTSYHLAEGNVETWHTLLVYAHILPMLEKVRNDAKRFKDHIQSPKETTSKSTALLAAGTKLTIVPSCKGVSFNPDRISLRWMEDFNRADFRFKADRSLSGDAAKGRITIYVGPLIIGTLKFAMLFNDRQPQPVPEHEENARMYGSDDVFISYSRKDAEVARAFKTILAATGMNVFIDVDNLKSGQLWNDELLRRIERADIFQMFWSSNYSQSNNCKMEWEHALKQNKPEGYIRPVFWRQPLSPYPPEPLSKFNFQYVQLPNGTKSLIKRLLNLP